LIDVLWKYIIIRIFIISEKKESQDDDDHADVGTALNPGEDGAADLTNVKMIDPIPATAPMQPKATPAAAAGLIVYVHAVPWALRT